LRPHTLTVPKPLVPIAGKPIVQRLAEDIVKIYDGKVDEIAFIIGDFGKEVEQSLLEVAADLGAKGSIYYQDEPLGTAHAIWMAEQSMDGEIIIAFADTLFRADFVLDRSRDGVIWVKRVDNPSSFGVVTLDQDGVIVDLVEKPQEFVSDLAIIGIYYIKDGAALREEIRNLIDNDIREKGEYQLTNALENLKDKGTAFLPGTVKEWMDCGNKNAVLDTTQKVLHHLEENGEALVSDNVKLINSVIIPPCHIGENVEISHSVIGPNVSIGDNTVLKGTVMEGSIVGYNSHVRNIVLKNSMIGNHAEITVSYFSQARAFAATAADKNTDIMYVLSFIFASFFLYRKD